MKNLYFAPLEGITGYIYRNTHEELFGGCDAYYAPFITPVENERLSIKCLRDILPEKNNVSNLRVQVLCSRLDAFMRFEKEIIALGYDEVNLNFGCPSGTVVKKGRGAGFLREPEDLDNFLKDVFEHTELKVSVKTRLGYSDASEMDELICIYNKYHLQNLIVHPRTRMDYYKGTPNMEQFKKTYDISVNPLCYNGNIFTALEYENICSAYPDIEGVMLGRGAVANPAIFREIRGRAQLKAEELIEFSALLEDRYFEVLKSDAYTLHKLKEVWIYMMQNFPEEKKILKSIEKSGNLADLNRAISGLKGKEILNKTSITNL
ncbi:MAG: tRNA-dihydrouridine synthase family protein [Clostridia bacterium]|nr:tRNA-dihydrouridine synthase family protein [Clostridia bacterium]